MQKIYEKDVAKKTFLNKKPWKFKIIIIILIMSILVSCFLIWAYAFKGLLYLEYKKETKMNYENIVLKEDNLSECAKLYEENAKTACTDFIKERDNYYLSQEEGNVIKYVPIYKVESIASENNIIFVVTNNLFKDKRNYLGDEKLMSTTFFIYKENESEYSLYDILYLEKHLDKLEEYKK